MVPEVPPSVLGSRRRESRGLFQEDNTYLRRPCSGNLPDSFLRVQFFFPIDALSAIGGGAWTSGIATESFLFVRS